MLLKSSLATRIAMITRRSLNSNTSKESQSRNIWLILFVFSCKGTNADHQKTIEAISVEQTTSSPVASVTSSILPTTRQSKSTCVDKGSSRGCSVRVERGMCTNPVTRNAMRTICAKSCNACWGGWHDTVNFCDVIIFKALCYATYFLTSWNFISDFWMFVTW